MHHERCLVCCRFDGHQTNITSCFALPVHRYRQCSFGIDSQRCFGHSFLRHPSPCGIYNVVVQISRVQPRNGAPVIVGWFRTDRGRTTTKGSKNTFDTGYLPVCWHLAQPLSPAIYVGIVPSHGGWYRWVRHCDHASAVGSILGEKANYSGFRKERIKRLLAWLLLYPFLSPSVVVFERNG